LSLLEREVPDIETARQERMLRYTEGQDDLDALEAMLRVELESGSAGVDGFERLVAGAERVAESSLRY
jgi:hypothetical protein